MDNVFEMMLVEQEKQEIGRVMDCNHKTQQFGLALSEEEGKGLMLRRKNSLKENERVEFGQSILPELIFEFCDSQYMNQENYSDFLGELQEIFYLYKNETKDELTDHELLIFMRRQFDEICFGDLEYLRSTCLDRYARAIRSGYQSVMQKRLRDEYSLRNSENEYHILEEESRWDYELYKLSLEDLY